MGKKYSRLIGGARSSVFSGWMRSTSWSHNGFLRSPEIANKRNFWVAWGAEPEFTGLLIHCWFNLTAHGIKKKQNTHIPPKHYLLHWNSMIPLIFNCKMPMFRSHRQTHRRRTLINVTKYFTLKCLTRHFLVFRNLFFIFICMNDTMVKSTVVSALNNAQLTRFLNLMITKTVG